MSAQRKNKYIQLSTNYGKPISLIKHFQNSKLKRDSGYFYRHDELQDVFVKCTA